MEQLCRFELCNLAEQIIGEEYEAPHLTLIKNEEYKYQKARSMYVYICRVYLDASFQLIRKTMPVYGYPKTVHQVFKRAYERRNKDDNRFQIAWLRKELENKITTLKSQDITVRQEGVQMKMKFN